MKIYLKDNNNETYSPKNEGKSIIGERSIRTLVNTIHWKYK